MYIDIEIIFDIIISALPYVRACFLLQGQFFVETYCMHPSWWEGYRDENILCGSNGFDSQITRSYFL